MLSYGSTADALEASVRVIRTIERLHKKLVTYGHTMNQAQEAQLGALDIKRLPCDQADLSTALTGYR